jgi:hypothetical protein
VEPHGYTARHLGQAKVTQASCLIRRAGFPACRARLAKQGCLADKTGWKPVLRRQRAVDARQHFFFPENFEQVIQTWSHCAASRCKPCGVDDCAEFYT